MQDGQDFDAGKREIFRVFKFGYFGSVMFGHVCLLTRGDLVLLEWNLQLPTFNHAFALFVLSQSRMIVEEIGGTQSGGYYS